MKHGIPRKPMLAAYLIDEILAVIIAEHLSADDAVHIGLHELLNEIDLPEVVERWGTKNVEDGDDVFVAEVSEELDLAQSTKTKHGMVKGSDALYGYLALRRYVHRRAKDRACMDYTEWARDTDNKVDVPDDAVCALADDIEDLVVCADDEARQSFVHDF